ncbi:MAG: YchJ family protein [Gammaproteobacteria bacterium]|nr:YchJ family protein [Gammaproteobacteria bacterium]MCP5299922.1 YchJ family protein [Chromatiaceae bacterium]
MSSCPCGSGHEYESCCQPYIEGTAIPPTAELLMRSRYSAYVRHAIDYLGETLHPDSRGDWDREATRRWAENAGWQGLDIVATEAGDEGDDEGVVEFVARFEEDGRLLQHRERSRFRRLRGRWYYLDGETPRPRTERHQAPKVGRNDPCPCGSGKKFKKCCGA